MTQVVQPRHQDGRWAEMAKADPGSSVLGIPSPVAEKLLADAAEGISGGDIDDYADILRSLADSGRYGPGISVDVDEGTLFVTADIERADGIRARVQLAVDSTPGDTLTGVEAIRAYADGADFWLGQLQRISAEVHAEDISTTPTAKEDLGAGQPDALGNPERFVWNGRGFTRCDVPAAAPFETYGFLIRAGRPISDDEMTRLAQAAGYAWASTVHGESLPQPERVDERSLYLFADSTKGRGILDDFAEQLPHVVAEGSPVRKTNRTGPKGTRLVDGLPELGGFSLYFED